MFEWAKSPPFGLRLCLAPVRRSESTAPLRLPSRECDIAWDLAQRPWWSSGSILHRHCFGTDTLCPSLDTHLNRWKKKQTKNKNKKQSFTLRCKEQTWRESELTEVPECEALWAENCTSFLNTSAELLCFKNSLQCSAELKGPITSDVPSFLSASKLNQNCKWDSGRERRGCTSTGGDILVPPRSELFLPPPAHPFRQPICFHLWTFH